MKTLRTLLQGAAVAAGLLLTTAAAHAQAPVNDLCTGALTVVPAGAPVAGTTTNANDDLIGLLGCQTGAPTVDHPDVWYSFTATGTQLAYTVTPSILTPNAPLEVLIFDGTCAGGVLVIRSDCNAGTVTGTVGGLVSGNTYLVAVASPNAQNTGAFTLQLTTSTPPVLAAQDCNQAAILPNGNTFSQQTSNAGSGSTANEVTTGNSCFGSLSGSNTVERQSKWFKFVAGKSGKLLFNINPVVQNDDYDWAVWDITNNPQTCAAKGNAIACNWTGARGATGLSFCPNQEPGRLTGLTDQFDNTTTNQTGANAPITITAGHVYALLVDNYSTSNSGFTLIFGGACAVPAGQTATQIGLDAEFTFTKQGCSTVNFAKTRALGTGAAAVSYFWNFGDGVTSTQATPTHVYAATGSNVYTVTLQITDVFGNRYTTSQPITIAPPTVQVAVTGATAICPGQSVLLLASGAATYSWSPATGLSSTTGAAVTATPTQTTTYTVTGTRDQCTNTQTVTITVTPPPVVTVVPSTPNPICAGQSLTLTARGGAGATYAWAPATGLSSATDSVVTATPAQTTTYTVTVTRGGCTSTAQQTVTVTPTVTASIQTPSRAPICAGQSVTLNAHGGATYSWSPATGLSSATDSVVTASPTQTTTYTVTATRGACTDTDTITVRVSRPVQLALAANGPTAICAGQGVVLTARAGSDVQYSWTPATGLSNTADSVVTAAPVQTTTYTVTATRGACSTTDTITVRVSRPVQLALAANGPISVCQGAPVTLTARGGAQYTWSPAAGLSSTTDSTVTATPTQTTTYTVTATRGTCTSTDTITVRISQPIQLALAATDTVICTGGTTTLSVSGGDTYQWSPTTGLSSTTDATVTAAPTQTTTYTVTALRGTCSATSQIRVEVGQQPAPRIVVADSVVATGETVTLKLRGATSFVFDNPALVTRVNDSTYTAAPTQDTEYNVTGYIGNCSAPARRTLLVTYPVYNVITPNGDNLNDVFSAKVSFRAIHVQVFNRWGRKVFDKENYQNDWNGDDLPAGTYYYHIEDAGGKTWKGWLQILR